MPDPVLRVALPLPLPRLFDYLPPPALDAVAAVGARLRVPFGSRELVGVISAIDPAPADPATPPLKAALALLDPDPLLGGELLESLRWLARYTHAPLGEVLATALPGPLRHGEPLADTHEWAWRLTEAGQTARERLRGKPRRLAELLQSGPCAAGEGRLDAETSPLRPATAESRLDAQIEAGAARRARWPSATSPSASRCRPRRSHPSRNRAPCSIPNSSWRSTPCWPRAAHSPHSCWTASPAAARPRSTCMRSPTAWRAAAKRWCWCRRSA